MNLNLEISLDDLGIDKEFKEDIRYKLRELIFELIDKAVKKDKRIASMVDEIKEAVISELKLKNVQSKVVT